MRVRRVRGSCDGGLSHSNTPTPLRAFCLVRAWIFGGYSRRHMHQAVPCRCRATMAHVRQSRPDSGTGFQAKVLKTFQVAPSSLGSGWSKRYLLPAWSFLPTALPSKEGTLSDVLRTFAWRPRPESGLDFLTCATFAEQREVVSCFLSLSLLLSSLEMSDTQIYEP